MSVTIYKVGGSLFGLPDLRDRLTRLLRNRPDERPLLVAGGGSAPDLVREWDRIHALGQETAHWLALDAMSLNERFLSRLLPGGCVVRTRNEFEDAWSEGHIPILNAASFLRSGELSGGETLPHAWDVTSDSIAAFVAIHWPADRLVLLKSVPRPAARVGRSDAVDAHFKVLAPRIARIDWCNLRDDKAVVAPWLP